MLVGGRRHETSPRTTDTADRSFVSISGEANRQRMRSSRLSCALFGEHHGACAMIPGAPTGRVFEMLPLPRHWLKNSNLKTGENRYRELSRVQEKIALVQKM